MATSGYFLSDGRIMGPKESGAFYIEGQRICGPRNDRLYSVGADGHIYGGATQVGQWSLSGSHFYGPSDQDPPWLSG